MNKDDKLKALDAALTQIERAYGKGSVMKLGDSGANMNIETVPTGSSLRSRAVRAPEIDAATIATSSSHTGMATGAEAPPAARGPPGVPQQLYHGAPECQIA